MKYKHLFGPVDSRRLGKSLGIDLIPFKTCSLDCVFCECGKTTCLTTAKKNYISTDEVMRELKEYLGTNPPLDYITFSGAGEPTLADNIGQIISFLKKDYPQYKVCVLTNGTLLWDPLIRKRIISADLISPTLSAASDQAYRKINRPVQTLDVEKIIEGLVTFRQEFKGKFWLEVFIVPGVNDTIDELTLLKNAIQEINPDRIQLNSLDRQGTEKWVEQPSLEQMQKIQEFLKPLATEIVSRNKPDSGTLRRAERAQ